MDYGASGSWLRVLIDGDDGDRNGRFPNSDGGYSGDRNHQLNEEYLEWGFVKVQGLFNSIPVNAVIGSRVSAPLLLKTYLADWLDYQTLLRISGRINE